MGSPAQDDDIGALDGRVAGLEAAGRSSEAIALAERHVEAAKTRFGEDHPAFAAAMLALAGVLRRAGRLEEAEALLRRAITVYEKDRGAHEAELARAFGILAQVLADAGRVAEAEALRPYAVGAAPPGAAEPDAPRVDPGALAGQPAGPSAPQPAPAAAMPRRPEPEARPASRERRAPPKPQEEAKRALEIDAGRLAYQIPGRMWVGVQETVEVRLGRAEAGGITEGFGGRGEVRAEDIPIVETMSVTLMGRPGAFDIVPMSEKDQLVKPDLVLGTPFHGSDFARWVWLVTPLQRGEQTLHVKVSAAVRDSRGLPATAALPDRTFAVTVRVQLVRTALTALARTTPGLAWVVVTTVVGILTKDYWWPAIRQWIGLE